MPARVPEHTRAPANPRIASLSQAVRAGYNDFVYLSGHTLQEKTDA